MRPAPSLGLMPLLLFLIAASASGQASDGDPIGAQVDAIRALRRSRAAEAPPAARSPRAMDLSDQFPAEAWGRDQANVNDCHDFVTVAVMEAAYFRATGRRLALSQADLFIQNTMLARDAALRARELQDDPAWAAHPITSEYIADGTSNRAPSETDLLTLDFRFAVAHGVAAAETLPYAAFRKDYEERQRPAIAGDMAAVERDMKADFERNHVDTSRVARINGMEMTVEGAQREAEVQTRIGPRMRARVAQFLARQDPRSRGSVDVSRANVREVTKSFAVDSLPSAPDCAQDPDGRRQTEFLMKELAAGRPVGVSLDIAGLPGWGHEGSAGPEMHGIVILGFRYDGGRPVYTTLNSWGPQSSLPVPAGQACRIAELTAIRVPGER